MCRYIFLTSILILGFLFFPVLGDLNLPGFTPQEKLTILTPYDQNLNRGLQTIAMEYGNEHNTIIDIISVKGRKKIVEEILKGNTSADLVVIEETYPIFNLTGLVTLEKKGFIEKSEELYQSEAELVVAPDSSIESEQDLDGTRFAAVDLVNYHMPGGCLANSIMDVLPVQVTVVNQSGIDGIYEAVSNASADATILWKSDYESQKTKNGELKIIPLPDYCMTNYIATLKNSSNPTEAESFMTFVLEHRDEIPT